MSARGKQALQLARQLFRLSVVDGSLSGGRVTGVLAYVEAHPPADPLATLRAYRRLVAAEVALGLAVVEHAGQVSEFTLHNIAAALSGKYGRPVAAVSRPEPALVAGLRVRVGDDVYESSVAGHLAGLAAAL
jgi:F-type H+-transporting ATPase subunit delta